jgi:hypothetical protein
VNKRSALLVAAAAALVALATVVVAPRLADLKPESDFAVIDIQVQNVLRGWQGTGVYSRVGVAHPGPLYVQVLAPLYAATGLRHASVIATVVALNVASLILIIATIRTRGSGALLFALLLLFTVYLLRMEGLLAGAWNPHVAMLPLAALLAIAAAIMTGTSRLLPLAVAIASFIVQAHMAFAVPVAAILVVSAVAVVLRARHADAAEFRELRRSTAIAVVVGMLLWAIPLADEFRPGGERNLRAIAAYFQTRTPHDPRQAGRAFEHLAVSPLTPGLSLWSTPIPEGPSRVRPTIHIQMVVLGLSAAVYIWRRRTFELSLAILTIVGLAAAALAMRRLPEPVHGYTVMWVTVLGVYAWALPIAAALSFIPTLGARIPLRALSSLAMTLAIIGGVIEARAQFNRDLDASARIEALRAAVLPHLTDGIRPRVMFTQNIWGVGAGLIRELDRAGLDPEVDPEWASMFGGRFLPDGRPSATIFLTESVDATARTALPAGAQQIIETHGVTTYLAR